MTWFLLLAVVALCLDGLLLAGRWLHARYVRRQIARIEREGLAALDWHLRHSHGGWR